MRQETVDAHLSRVGALTKEFQQQMQAASKVAADQVVGFLGRSIRLVDGKAPPSAENMGVLRTLDKVLFQAIPSSGYHEVVATFVSQLPVQITEFEAMYEEMLSEMPYLPSKPPAMSSQDAENFGMRAALSISALDALVHSVAANIRKSMFMMVGNISLDSYASHIRGTVEKLGDVERYGRDIVLSFFRGVAEAAYDKIDGGTDTLLLEYAGPSGQTKRNFCVKAYASPATLSEVRAMDNGQIPGALTACGGFGCRHYWVPKGVRQ